MTVTLSPLYRDSQVMPCRGSPPVPVLECAQYAPASGAPCEVAEGLHSYLLSNLVSYELVVSFSCAIWFSSLFCQFRATVYMRGAGERDEDEYSGTAEAELIMANLLRPGPEFPVPEMSAIVISSSIEISNSFFIL